jgi:hypothetical protein
MDDLVGMCARKSVFLFLARSSTEGGTTQLGNRSPSDLAAPCGVDQASTRYQQGRAHADDHQISLRFRAAMLGLSNWGSTRASRASVCTSTRSSFRLLALINFASLGLATTPSLGVLSV